MIYLKRYNAHMSTFGKTLQPWRIWWCQLKTLLAESNQGGKRKSENMFKTLGSRETQSGAKNAQHTNTGVTFKAQIF